MIFKEIVVLMLIFFCLFSTMTQVSSAGISWEDSMDSEWSWEFNENGNSEGEINDNIH